MAKGKRRHSKGQEVEEEAAVDDRFSAVALVGSSLKAEEAEEEASSSNDGSEVDSSSDGSDEVEEDAEIEAEKEKDDEEDEEEDEEEEEEDSEETERKKAKAVERQKRKMIRAAEKYRDKEMQKGVIYLSRVPPHMKPEKVRHLLSQYGVILRIFLNPESKEKWAKRKKGGGNKKLSYEDGWVEFADKKVARRVAEALNGQQMGGNRRNWYHDDLWSMRYLPKFKWHHLTERIAHEKRTKDARTRIILSRAKKESSLYMKQVDKSKMIRAMEEKKQRRAAAAGASDSPTKSASGTKRKRSEAESDEMEKVKRQFRQHRAIAPGTDSTDRRQARTSSILSKMLGGEPAKKKRKA